MSFLQSLQWVQLLRGFNNRSKPPQSALRARIKQKRLAWEPLEARLLMAAVDCRGPVDMDDIYWNQNLRGVPELHSKEDADAAIYLDFDGFHSKNWLYGDHVPGDPSLERTIPSFDLDGRPYWFEGIEPGVIEDIWRRVAEDYLPFDVDVTTIHPCNDPDRTTPTSGVVHVAIGGTSQDIGSGGLGAPNGFNDPNLTSTALVRAMETWGAPRGVRDIAHSISHEAAHVLGLVGHHHNQTCPMDHWTGEYIPIVATPTSGFEGHRDIWVDDKFHDQSGCGGYKNDVAHLRGVLGIRSDDVGNDATSATRLQDTGASGSANVLQGDGFVGLLPSGNDKDFFLFEAKSGDSFTVTVNVPRDYVGNLHAEVELWRKSGNTWNRVRNQSDANNPAGPLGATLRYTPSDWWTEYAVAVKGDSLVSNSGLIDLGSYTVTVRGQYVRAVVSDLTTGDPVRFPGPEITTGEFVAKFDTGRDDILRIGPKAPTRPPSITPHAQQSFPSYDYSLNQSRVVDSVVSEFAGTPSANPGGMSRSDSALNDSVVDLALASSPFTRSLSFG